MEIKSLNSAVSNVVRLPERASAQTERSKTLSTTDDAAKVSFASNTGGVDKPNSSEKVSSIREQYEKGTYKVDSEKIAQKLFVELF
jgi:anti-sigma28 factor (negative regulator of flagellin synthesis)